MWENLEITAERRRNYLVLKPNYQTTKFFTENVLAIEMKTKKTEIFMNKAVYLGLSIIELNKILMYEFRYGYVKPKTKVWQKSSIVLFGYREFDCIHKNRWYFWRYCRRC